MNTTTLVIGVVEKDNSILLRKKPSGVGPYVESWYLFGAEIKLGETTPEKVIEEAVKDQTGVSAKVVEQLNWDTETKPDKRGTQTLHLYLAMRLGYINGDLDFGTDIEECLWVAKKNLRNYDLIPPARKLLKSMGYLRN